MFLGNLSSTAERQARKAKKTKKDKDGSDDESNEPVTPLRRAGEMPIVHTGKDGNDVPREALLTFLQCCVEMMMDPVHQKSIIQNAFKKRIGLHMAAIDFQRDVLEFNCQIERNYGCQYLSMLGVKCPEDTEVIEAAKNFMLGCMKCYVKCVKLRSKLYKSGALPSPSPNQALTRTCILEFFEACNATMAMPETKQELKEIYASTNELPGQRVIDIQRNILKLLGYSPDWAVSCLNKIPQDFGNDREVMIKMNQFALCAETACREAAFTDQERENFYKDIPPLMHHFPHMHLMQQRMAQQQMMAQQMANSGDRAKEIEMLKKSGILNLITSPGGREKLSGLVERITEAKKSHDETVKSWTEDEKLSFLDNFENKDVVSAIKSKTGDDPLEKITAFIELSDSDLADAVSFQALLQDDKLVSHLKESGNFENSAIQLIQTTISSLSNANSRMLNQSGQSHSHTHSHGQSCSMHGGGSQPDVSQAKSSKMDR